jgi:hypothetical protein
MSDPVPAPDASTSSSASDSSTDRRSTLRGKLIVAVVLVIVIGLGIASVIMQKQSLKNRLVGTWHGEGELPASISIHLGPETRPTSGPTMANATVDATFSPEGTYRWSQRNQDSTQFLNTVVPAGDAAPPPYMIVDTSVFSDEMRLKIAPVGECILKFHGRDAFTLEGPGGKLEFKRKQ